MLDKFKKALKGVWTIIDGALSFIAGVLLFVSLIIFVVSLLLWNFIWFRHAINILI